MNEWRPDITKYIYRHLEKGKRRGDHIMALQGARRASKTYTACQFLLVQMLTEGDVCVFASMTSEQGRKGAYEDCKTILRDMPVGISQYFETLKTPREIHCKSTPNGRAGVAYFSSFQDPETAKGVACDWVFINEANKFTLQQYYDLAANARKGVILDYNPQAHFWVEDLKVKPLKCTWQKNKNHLTKAQLQWFADIKAAAMKPNATAADWYYYLVYYKGEYSELAGTIFTRGNIDVQPAEAVPYGRLTRPVLFADPSALRGADYFPLVVAAMDRETGDMWVLETDTTNTGTREERLQRIMAMAGRYDGTRVFIEVNGLVGVEFRDFCQNSGFEAEYWDSRGNKFERIIAHYQELTRHTHFADSPVLGEYLQQVYEFAKKCEHDDNIDAVNSAYMVLNYLRADGSI